MKLTTTLIADKLSQAYPDIDWYVNFVPEAEQTIPSLPLGRITEVGYTHDSYASNDPLMMETTIQVDVWFKTLSEAQEIYYDMDKLFYGNYNSLSYSEIGTDPDIENAPRIIKRYTITRNIKLG